MTRQAKQKGGLGAPKVCKKHADGDRIEVSED